MTVKISKDQGTTWSVLQNIFPGRSAYSALALLKDGSVGLLYEKSTLPQIIFLPEAISFRIVWPSPA